MEMIWQLKPTPDMPFGRYADGDAWRYTERTVWRHLWYDMYGVPGGRAIQRMPGERIHWTDLVEDGYVHDPDKCLKFIVLSSDDGLDE